MRDGGQVCAEQHKCDMTEIGIVSVHKTNRLRYKFFGGIEISERKEAYIPCLNAAVFVSEGRYAKAKDKDFLKLYEKAVKKLKRKGVKRIYKTNEFAAMCGGTECDEIPPKLMTSVFFAAKAVCKTDAALPKLTINAADSVDLKKMLTDVVMCAKRTEVYAKDMYAAECAADYIFERFGVITDVYDASDYNPSGSKYVIDTERRYVRIGDFTADGIVLGADTGCEKTDIGCLFGRDMTVNIKSDEALSLLSEYRNGTYKAYIKKLVCGGRMIEI